MLSRRYDIEFRTQYYYTLDSESGEYVEVKVQVPMIFIQQEKLGDFTKDVNKANGGLTLSVGLSDKQIETMEQYYSATVSVFIENKDLVTEEAIKVFIGEKIKFDE